MDISVLSLDYSPPLFKVVVCESCFCFAAALCQAGPDLDDDNSRSRGGMYEFGNVSAGAGGSNHKSHLSELTISTGMVSSHHGGGLNNASASVVRAAYGADSSGVPSKPTTASTNADCSYFPCKLCGK